MDDILKVIFAVERFSVFRHLSGGTHFLVQSVYAAVGVEMEPQLAGEEVIPEDV